MEARAVEFKEKLRNLFTDVKAREFALNFVLPRLIGSGSEHAIKVAHIIGGKRADPDAAASAKAIAFCSDKIAGLYNESSEAQARFEHYFFGEGLTGPENNVFKRDCRIALSDFSEFQAQNYDLILGYETVELDDVVTRLDAVWDTHDKLPKSNQTVLDIRPELTATSMIAIRYILPFLEEDGDEIGYLTAALKYGIESDFLSSGFHRRSDEEKELESAIDPYVKHDVLGSIHSAKVKKFDYWKILETQTRSEQYGSFVICMMGFLQVGQIDYLWRHANALIRTDGVSTVLCFGILDDKIVYKTRRDEDGVVDLNELEVLLLKRKHESEVAKIAGSRSYAGGGELNLCPLPKHLVSLGDEKKKFANGVFETLKERIASLLAQNL